MYYSILTFITHYYIITIYIIIYSVILFINNIIYLSPNHCLRGAVALVDFQIIGRDTSTLYSNYNRRNRQR